MTALLGEPRLDSTTGEVLPPHTIEVDGVWYPDGTRSLVDVDDPDDIFPHLAFPPAPRPIPVCEHGAILTRPDACAVCRMRATIDAALGRTR